MSEPVEEPVPKLPRGRGLRLSKPELFRIALTLLTLIGVIVLTRPCANAVSGFVTSFDGSGSAKEKTMPKPGNVDLPGSAAPGSAAPGGAPEIEYEHLKPGMTEAEIKAAMERSKARNAAAAGSGAGSAAGSAAPASGSGQATGSASQTP